MTSHPDAPGRPGHLAPNVIGRKSHSRTTLIELWAWGQPKDVLRDRAASPWDDPERRPSHADRRKALQRQCLRQEFRHLAEGQPVTPEIQEFVGRVIHQAA